MPNEAKKQDEQQAPTLGRKLRACRKEAALTMQVVADRAGLSVGFISQIERDLTVPSISSLRAISKVLGKPMSFFLEQPGVGSNTTRRRERVEYQVGRGAPTFERLSTRFDGSTLRSVLIHEPSGHRTEPSSHEGEELYFMVRGEITVEVEGKATVLKEGDSIHFNSRRLHSTWNHGAQTATFLWCGTMDVFDEDGADPR
ncbi:helix-turn-helix domain-containing protein [Sinisalibacter aestuarii]|nr:cupin domain-containing protein [Sinisalibacter aestuarii]